MHWIILIAAGIFEIGFAFCLGKAKDAAPGSSTIWYLGFVAFLITSIYLLVKATHALPIGTAYAIWTGIGAVGTVLIGILVFKDPVNFWRAFFITTLVGSIIGLKLVSVH